MTKDEYDEYTELFATAGWRRCIKAYGELRQALLESCPYSAVSNDQWQYARGQLNQLDALLGFEQYIDHVWRQENEEVEDDDESV